MHIATVILALVALAVANPVPGGVSSAVAPQSSPPPGCSENYEGTFTIEPTNVTSSSKRDLEEVCLQFCLLTIVPKLTKHDLSDPL